jgi:hypothetical protein
MMPLGLMPLALLGISAPATSQSPPPRAAELLCSVWLTRRGDANAWYNVLVSDTLEYAVIRRSVYLRHSRYEVVWEPQNAEADLVNAPQRMTISLPLADETAVFPLSLTIDVDGRASEPVAIAAPNVVNIYVNASTPMTTRNYIDTSRIADSRFPNIAGAREVRVQAVDASGRQVMDEPLPIPDMLDLMVDMQTAAAQAERAREARACGPSAIP